MLGNRKLILDTHCEIYSMIKDKTSYKEIGLDYYDKLHKERAVKNLHRFAARLERPE